MVSCPNRRSPPSENPTEGFSSDTLAFPLSTRRSPRALPIQPVIFRRPAGSRTDLGLGFCFCPGRMTPPFIP